MANVFGPKEDEEESELSDYGSENENDVRDSEAEADFDRIIDGGAPVMPDDLPEEMKNDPEFAEFMKE